MKLQVAMVETFSIKEEGVHLQLQQQKERCQTRNVRPWYFGLYL